MIGEWPATPLSLDARIAGEPLWTDTKEHLDRAVRCFSRASSARARWQHDGAVMNAMQAVIHAANGVASFLVGGEAIAAGRPDDDDSSLQHEPAPSTATARQAADAVVGAAIVVRSALSIVRHT